MEHHIILKGGLHVCWSGKTGYPQENNPHMIVFECGSRVEVTTPGDGFFARGAFMGSGALAISMSDPRKGLQDCSKGHTFFSTNVGVYWDPSTKVEQSTSPDLVTFKDGSQVEALQLSPRVDFGYLGSGILLFKKVHSPDLDDGVFQDLADKLFQHV